jgi:hypothetical protein
MKQLFIFIILNFSFLIVMSCSENGVKPPPPEEKLCEITDSTSHAVTWRVDTIGVWPSILYDISAIDANNVWAVGEVWTPEKDTVWNNENTKNNAVKWNGKEYEYFQLAVVAEGGAMFISNLSTLLTFSENDIWLFSEFGSYVRWDGNSWKSEYIGQSQIGSTKDAWGVSSSDFYLVGNHGSITHYNGSSFSLMETGTDISLFEIKGFVDPHTGKQHIWALGFENGISVVLKLEDGIWTNVWDMELLQNNFRFPHALYIDNNKTIVMDIWNGPGQKGRLYCFNQNDFTDYKMLAEHSTFSEDMGVISLNDVFFIGPYKIEHFNGNSIHFSSELAGIGWFLAAEVFKEKIFITGFAQGEKFAPFIHGQR